jgi:hypothetical protein
LKLADARELAGRPESRMDGDLARTIAKILDGLPRLSEAITADYFAHSTISRTGRGSEP